MVDSLEERTTRRRGQLFVGAPDRVFDDCLGVLVPVPGRQQSQTPSGIVTRQETYPLSVRWRNAICWWCHATWPCLKKNRSAKSYGRAWVAPPTNQACRKSNSELAFWFPLTHVQAELRPNGGLGAVVAENGVAPMAGRARGIRAFED
jgi:hypothetical protein